VQHSVTNWHVDRARAAEWEEIARQLDEMARTAPGFLHTRTLRSVEHPGKFVVYGCWESREHWESYFNRPEVQALIRRTFPLLKGPPQQEWFDLIAETAATQPCR
jgi:quinol monooxygenase YgiN